MTVRGLISAIIETSDNTASNRRISMLGIQAVNRTLEEMSFRVTRLQRKMLHTAVAAKDQKNISTPQEMAHVSDLIYHGKAVEAQALKEIW